MCIIDVKAQLDYSLSLRCAIYDLISVAKVTTLMCKSLIVVLDSSGRGRLYLQYSTDQESKWMTKST